MTYLFDHTTGLERIQREACMILADQLNDRLAEQEAAGQLLDAAFNAHMGINYPVVTLERIPTQNIIPGHRPSLIKAPVHMYPNISVMAFTMEEGGDDIDHAYGVTDTMFFEVMVKAGPYGRDDTSGIGEYLCNCRINRTVDAVVSIFSDGYEAQTLNGLVGKLYEAPVVGISNVFTRTEGADGVLAEGIYFFQGARIEYAVDKYIKAY